MGTKDVITRKDCKTDYLEFLFKHGVNMNQKYFKIKVMIYHKNEKNIKIT